MQDMPEWMSKMIKDLETISFAGVVGGYSLENKT